MSEDSPLELESDVPSNALDADEFLEDANLGDARDPADGLPVGK